MTQGASKMWVLVIRGRRTNRLLLAQERRRGLLFHERFKDRAAPIRVKARSGLLASQGR